MLIYLIGMSACGKTTWGKRLSQELQFDFVDTDTWIEQKNRKSVSELFALGESVFREEEQKAIKEIASYKNTVVATGGGLPCCFDNIDVLKKSGCIIYIERDIKTLLAHLKNNTTERPLYKDTIHLEAFLKEQLEKRYSFYKQAHFTITNPKEELFKLFENISKK